MKIINVFFFRYLASGDSMASLKFGFRVSVCAISSIVKETCSAIWEQLKTKVFPVDITEEYWLTVAKQFFNKWNFPNCIGAIDGKHVVMQVNRIDRTEVISGEVVHFATCGFNKLSSLF
jgi:hypothetical protein